MHALACARSLGCDAYWAARHHPPRRRCVPFLLFLLQDFNTATKSAGMIRQKADTPFEGAPTALVGASSAPPPGRAAGLVHLQSRRASAANGGGGGSALLLSSVSLRDGRRMASKRPKAEMSLRSGIAAIERRPLPVEAAPFRRHFSTSRLPLVVGGGGLSTPREPSVAALSPPPSSRRTQPWDNKAGRRGSTGAGRSLASVIDVIASAAAVGGGGAAAGQVVPAAGGEKGSGSSSSEVKEKKEEDGRADRASGRGEGRGKAAAAEPGTPRAAKLVYSGKGASPRRLAAAVPPPPVTDAGATAASKRPALGGSLSVRWPDVQRVLSTTPAAPKRYGLPGGVPGGGIKLTYTRGDPSIFPPIPGTRRKALVSRIGSGLLSTGKAAGLGATQQAEGSSRRASPPADSVQGGGGSVRRPLMLQQRPALKKSASALLSADEPGAVRVPRQKDVNSSSVGDLALTGAAGSGGGAAMSALDTSRYGKLTAGRLGLRKGGFEPAAGSAAALATPRKPLAPKKYASAVVSDGQAAQTPRTPRTEMANVTALHPDSAEVSVTALLMAFMFVSHALPGEKARLRFCPPLFQSDILPCSQSPSLLHASLTVCARLPFHSWRKSRGRQQSTFAGAKSSTTLSTSC